jgi:hypothetical protein
MTIPEIVSQLQWVVPDEQYSGIVLDEPFIDVNL